MNERIKELWDQANSRYYQSESNQPLPQFIFAELIVRECADIAKGEPASFYDRDAYKLGRKWASEDVLKHFGVKE